MEITPEKKTTTPGLGDGIATYANGIDAYLRGSYENYGEMEGEAGLKTFSNGLNNTGIVLQYTPLSPIGIALNISSDLIETGLDFKNNNPNKWHNLGVRTATTLAGGVLDKMANKLPTTEINKTTIEGAINQGGEIMEDHYTKEEEE